MTRFAALPAALVCLVAAAAPAGAQDWRPKTKLAPRAPPAGTERIPERYRPSTSRGPAVSLRSTLRAPAATVTETEPNNTAAEATPVALGDVATGTIDPPDDIDYFAITLTAGTVLDLDVDANQVGSPLDPVIGLFDTDGVTLLASNDDFDGLDSRLTYSIPADGQYYVAIIDYGGSGGPNYTYSLSFGTLEPDEIEPNDTPGDATVIALAQQATAVVSPATDVDYFALDLPGSGQLDVELLLTTTYFYGTATVYDVDGTTVLASGDISSFPAVRVYVAAAGRYYVAIRDGAGAGGTGGLYLLTVRLRPTGPGDPTTLFATGFSFPYAIAAARGAVYVLDEGGSSVRRVSLGGAVTLVTQGLTGTGLAVDGFGNLLVPGYDSAGPAITRILPTGQRSIFARGEWSAGAITIGPDGDVWVATCSPQNCWELRRFDPLGAQKSTTAIDFMPYALAFSPGGVLHFTDGYDTVYRVAGTSIQTALQTAPYIEGLAFDEGGYLYVANGFLGTVQLFDPSYEAVNDPFAVTNLGGPIWLAFAREEGGAMTRRLLAANQGFGLQPPYSGGIVEMNVAGIRAPGFRVGVDLLAFLTTSLPSATVGAEYDETIALAETPAQAVAWSLASGALPPGLSLGPTTGVIAGIPTQDGTFTFLVKVTAGTRLGFQQLAIQVGVPTVSATRVADALLGVADALTPDEARYLDIQGNGNGVLDIGDIRAFLRRSGELPGLSRAAPLTAGRNQP